MKKEKIERLVKEHYSEERILEQVDIRFLPKAKAHEFIQKHLNAKITTVATPVSLTSSAVWPAPAYRYYTCSFRQALLCPTHYWCSLNRQRIYYRSC